MGTLVFAQVLNDDKLPVIAASTDVEVTITSGSQGPNDLNLNIHRDLFVGCAYAIRNNA